ncbi:uncharacterized protein LOC5522192 [Nematostella vectensis]|uniref:uncharacterized protein LOC5522192 n=1 Tax=Nematostella vectensis TaxID=45351 RepID=UPI00207710BE|nr:uncharacterized protein LOC5522192 [Nematostella vectensis]
METMIHRYRCSEDDFHHAGYPSIDSTARLKCEMLFIKPSRKSVFFFSFVFTSLLCVSYYWTGCFDKTFYNFKVVYEPVEDRLGYKQWIYKGYSKWRLARDWCRVQGWRVDWQNVTRPCKGKMAWDQRVVGSRDRTSARRSYISRSDIQPAGHFSRLWIQSVDMDGRRKSFGGDSWRVCIRQGPASLAPLVFDHDNGLYEVLVLVPEPGTYSAEVFLDYTLCDGIREPPQHWFGNGTGFGTYNNFNNNFLGYIGDDHIMKKLKDQDSHNFTVPPKTPNPGNQGNHMFTVVPHHNPNTGRWRFPSGDNIQCGQTGPNGCRWVWDGNGYWRGDKWLPYQPNEILGSTTKCKRSGTLWIYGDSLAMRFSEAMRTHPICTRMFKHCNYSYNWIYEVKDKRHPRRIPTPFNKTVVLEKLRSILELPEMRSPDSILVFSLGIHFPISLTFAEYKDLVDSAAVMFTRLAGSPGFPATVIWKSTAAFEKQKVTMVPWPGKQLNSTMLRFMTTQRNQLFHKYALSTMCTAGIPVLDVYPLTASFGNGTVDYVHYEDRVFFPAETAIEMFAAISQIVIPHTAISIDTHVTLLLIVMPAILKPHCARSTYSRNRLRFSRLRNGCPSDQSRAREQFNFMAICLL